MRKILLNSLFTSPAVLGAALVMSSSAFAAQKTEVAGLPALEVGTQTTQAASVKPLAEVKSLSVEKTAEFSSAKSVVVAEPVKVAQAATEVQATPSVDSLEQINRYSREGKTANSAGQVTSVSQLSDVRPTDWAFQALQSLVERYGCIAGYPDKTYRGNRALTRYEFAAGLNACLDRVNELIAAATADLVKKEDLATLQKLQEQFAAELATLRGRVDSLEARTSTLEKQQFSTTTKLAGEAIFALTDEFGVDGGGNNTVFQNRIRLALNTSFTGKDLLVTRIAAGNADLFNTPGGGAEGIQTFNFGNTGGNRGLIDWVAYYFPVGDNLKFYIPAVSGLHYDYAPTVSPALDAADGGTGPLSVFAQRNPIYLIGGGAGVGANYNLNNRFQVSLGYLADNSTVTRTLNPDGSISSSSPSTFGANNPSDKNGLFNGSYSALAQLTFSPSEALQIGLTYVNAYRRGAIFDGGSGLTSVGTSLANQSLNATGLLNNSAQVNAYGASVAFKLSPQVVINGFASYIGANFVDDGQGKKDIWTYGLGVAFPDFGKKGNLLGFMAGAEPYLGNPRGAGATNDIPLHFEGFYKYQLTDNISITPGVIWVVNPGQNDANDDVVIGTLRTTFTF
jgi:hypothetical protein